MREAIFIQTNDKQLVGAKVAKFALETRGGAHKLGIPVMIMNVDEMPLFEAFAGVTYRRGLEMRTHNPNDLQSFTLSRYMPPELMGFAGRALVIDPDVFALGDVSELFAIDLKDNAICARKRHDGWDSSVMLLDCAKLSHWKIADILERLKNLSLEYTELIRLRVESKVLPLPHRWNSHDRVDPDTRILHTTRRLTQPWKTGLPIDFTVGKLRPLFGFIPREPVRQLFAKRNTHYQPHPRRDVEKVFMELLKEAIDGGAVTQANLVHAIAHQFVRADILQHIA